MKIIKDTGTNNTVIKGNRKLEYIVIHYSAGATSKTGSAASLAAWYRNKAATTSADYIVDDEAIVQYNPDIEHLYTYHCGGAKYSNKGGKFYGIATNKNSIGIEICSTNSTGNVKRNGKYIQANDKTWSFTDVAVANAVELVKHLMEKYNIDVDHVIRHYDTTGKPCPGIIGWNAESGSEAAWEDFKARLQPAKRKLYRVQIGAFSSRENAERYADKAEADGYSAFVVEV